MSRKIQFDLETEQRSADRDLALKDLIPECKGEEEIDIIVRHVSYLLNQRQKIEAGLLDESLPPEVKSACRRFLGKAEEDDHTHFGVDKGSIIFTLFCKHKSKRCHLQERSQAIAESFIHLCETLGMFWLYLTC